MKKILLSFVAIATLSFSSFGQAPEGFKYQAVVRDAGNVILNNQAVGMRMTIRQGAIGGTTVYSETFSTTTNAYGIVNLEIGNGTLAAGNFTSIDWANGPFFMETAVDVTGGINYSVMGTSQLMSVPYALYAKTSGSSTPGPQGPQGIQGPAGNEGAQGLTGLTGPQGPAGNDGATGPAGPQGIQGVAGNDGAQGLQGPAGIDGINGANGNGILSTTDNGDGTFTLNYTDGTSFTTSNLTGPTGSQGPAGNDGAIGAQGPQGPAGNDGATGPQGIQGLAGNDGAQGLQGPAGIDGINGANGIGIASTTDNGNGTFTFNYTDGSLFTTSNLTGPVGPVGPTGAAGSADAWSRTGNAATVDGTNFIGTTDNIPFNIRVNNQKAGRIDVDGNTFYGYLSGNSNSANNSSTGIGHQALTSNTTGFCNSAIGVSALNSNTTGSYNTGSGVNTLYSNTTGNYNSASGMNALFSNTTGFGNSASGVLALYSNTIGNYNSASGMNALSSNTTGSDNTANGSNTLQYNITGFSNTANGHQALQNNTTGSYNTASGRSALSSNTTGNNNTALGVSANVASGNLNNATAIGANAIVDADNKIQLGDAAVTNVSTNGTLTAGVVTYPNTDGTAGQVLSTDGSGTLSWVNTSPCGLAIGQTYKGGIIFYLDASGCHGLISAPTDQSTGIGWYNGSYTNTTAFASCVGCGDGNTSMIVYNQGAGTYAAKLCSDLSLGGYSDWYLPSKYELNLMYQNIGQGNALGLGNVGGFANNFYWSSTEDDSYSAWGQYFFSGYQLDDPKGTNYYVRAVRAF